MSTIKSSAENLTLNADGANNDIIFQSNGSNVATLDQAGLLTATTFAGSGANLTSVNAVNGGRKNIIINGAMKVAQRGTSSTGLGDGDEGYVTLDRMRHTTNSASAGRFTSAQTAITDLVGFANCLHFDCTTADTSIAASEVLVLEHYIEGQDLQQFAKGTASAKDITVSFYMKTNKAFTFMCVLNDFDNNRVNPQQFTTTTTWTRHSITFSGDTTGTWDDDANRSLSVSIYLHAGSDHTGGTYSANTWQSRASSNNMIAVGIGSFYDSTSNDIKITGLQMELGSVATDFEHRSYGEELALCQRYYEIVADNSESSDTDVCYVGGAYSYKSDQINWHYTFAVKKRAAFTLEATTGTNYYKASLFGETILDTAVGMTASYQPLNGVHAYISGSYSGSTNGKAWLFMLNVSGAKIAVSAEL